MTKQIKIEELIPKMEPGYVACDKGGSWCYFSEKPFIKEDYWILDCSCVVEHIDYIELSIAFNIAPSKDWTKSLIKIERK